MTEKRNALSNEHQETCLCWLVLGIIVGVGQIMSPLRQY